jgi:chromatin assembly factor 1 subunit B
MDVNWSHDGTALLSGSIDNRAIIWDMSDRRRGQMLGQLANHKHFIQGVAWDPAQQIIATQSADRTCK